MIIPKDKVKEAHTFFWKGVRGAFWEDDEIIATTFLLAETQNTLELEQVIDELEHYANTKNKKMYITNFCSRDLLEIMDKREYASENLQYSATEGKWQTNIRYYKPQPMIRASLLPLEPFTGYNGIKRK